jgi:hypothetical protein
MHALTQRTPLVFGFAVSFVIKSISTLRSSLEFARIAMVKPADPRNRNDLLSVIIIGLSRNH